MVALSVSAVRKSIRRRNKTHQEVYKLGEWVTDHYSVFPASRVFANGAVGPDGTYSVTTGGVEFAREDSPNVQRFIDQMESAREDVEIVRVSGLIATVSSNGKRVVCFVVSAYGLDVEILEIIIGERFDDFDKEISFTSSGDDGTPVVVIVDGETLGLMMPIKVAAR